MALHAEDPALNQYWYSPNSIATLAAACVGHGGRVAFLSTPSVFFAIPEATRRASRLTLFEFDTTLGSVADGVVHFDFREPVSSEWGDDHGRLRMGSSGATSGSGVVTTTLMCLCT